MAITARADTMLMTPEEFLVYPIDEVKAELVRGELRVTPPPGGPHAMAQSNLLRLLFLHIGTSDIGRVFPDGIGYELIALPRTVRVPDASFVRADRLPAEGVGPGLLQLVPDLAIEVLSPSETAPDLQDKLDDYQVSHTPLVWVVDPARRTIMIIERGAPFRLLHESDVLNGGSVLPGFSCAASAVFEGIARAH